MQQNKILTRLAAGAAGLVLPAVLAAGAMAATCPGTTSQAAGNAGLATLPAHATWSATTPASSTAPGVPAPPPPCPAPAAAPAGTVTPPPPPPPRQQAPAPAAALAAAAPGLAPAPAALALAPGPGPAPGPAAPAAAPRPRLAGPAVRAAAAR